MKAIELLEKFVNGELDHERCGIAESDAVIIRGWFGYFGAIHKSGSIKPGENLFYLYIDLRLVLLLYQFLDY
jgi:hypothetical protein